MSARLALGDRPRLARYIVVGEGRHGSLRMGTEWVKWIRMQGSCNTGGGWDGLHALTLPAPTADGMSEVVGLEYLGECMGGQKKKEVHPKIRRSRFPDDTE